jgi:hypothetical protein
LCQRLRRLAAPELSSGSESATVKAGDRNFLAVEQLIHRLLCRPVAAPGRAPNLGQAFFINVNTTTTRSSSVFGMVATGPGIVGNGFEAFDQAQFEQNFNACSTPAPKGSG